MSTSSSVDPSADLPQGALRAIEPDERVVTWTLSDVDAARTFRKSCLILTQRRLISVPESSAGPVTSWPLAEIVQLKTRDRAGLGTLEALGEHGRLAVWHYTFDLGPAMLVLMDHFEALKAGRSIGVSERGEEPEPPEAEAHEPSPNTMALFRLWQFARKDQWWIALALGLSMLAAAGTILSRLLYRPLVNTLTEYSPDSGTFPNVTWYLVGMLGAFVLAWFLSWAQGVILALVSERITADLRQRAFAHLQKLSLEYFGGKRTGDLMTRLSNDADRLCQFLSDSVVDFAADCLLLIGISVSLFLQNAPLAAVTLAPFPFVLWVMYKSRDKLQTGFSASSKAYAALSSVLADTIPGIRVVKAFAQEHREVERFDVASQHLMQVNNRVNAVWTFFWPLIAFLNNLGVLVVWIYGVWLISRGELDIGLLISFVGLSQLFYSRLESMTRMVNSSQRAAASAQRIFEILDRHSSVPEPAQPVALTRLNGSLEFRHVGFRYGNRKVIKDLSLKIEPGEMIGLVGHTGAGKSTMINLVCRFFDVAEGAIYADGVDIRSYRVRDYRRNIGIVLQDPFLFYGTIAENISYGRPDATRAEIIGAARAARAHEFILQLPDGYDSLVGERGQSLSGGERQRISIARALLIDPRILILDEATSAVDTQTERDIQEALQNLVRGRTTIAIAHRLSTLRQANRIMVIERGRIVEIGTHEELLKLDGAYAALHKAQQALTKDIGW